MTVWLKAQLHCFPEDEEMLSFGEVNSEQRDEEWMRTTSVILTLIDHFNATFLPITPQRGAEGMCRSELSDKCHLFCGVELARLLIKCKEKKEEGWRSMECWLRREVSFCVGKETVERQDLIIEILTSGNEQSWLHLIQGISQEGLETYENDDMIVYLLLQKDIQWDFASLFLLNDGFICSVVQNITHHLQALIYALCLTSIPYLHSSDVIFTILTSLSSLPPNDTEVKQRQLFFILLFLLVHDSPSLFTHFLSITTHDMLLVILLLSLHNSLFSHLIQPPFLLLFWSALHLCYVML